MRVLVGCSLGGSGHLMPAASAARALRELGHESLLLVPSSLADRAAETGLDFVTGEEPPPEAIDEIWHRVKVGPEADVEYLIDRELFAGIAADALLSSAAAVCDEFEPDLIVREPCEYATATVARRLNLPMIQVAISQSMVEHHALEHVADVLERRQPGVVDLIRESPYLTPFPELLDPAPWHGTRRFRQARPVAGELPDWWPDRPELPLVYVTFGSVLGSRAGATEAYRAALDAVDGLPIRVLLTTGTARDIEALGSIPDNTHVERWVPQWDVFESAEMLVCHGGSGTTFGALSAGLPLVVCPMFSDQSANAALVGVAGVGQVLQPWRPADSGFRPLRSEDAASLRELIVSTLEEPSYRLAARKLGEEMATAPTLAESFAAVIGSA